MHFPDVAGQSELYVSKSGSAGPLNFDFKNTDKAALKRLFIGELEKDSDLSITVYAATEGINKATLSVSASMFTYIEDDQLTAKVSPYAEVGDVIIPQLGKIGGAEYVPSQRTTHNAQRITQNAKRTTHTTHRTHMHPHTLTQHPHKWGQRWMKP